MAGYSDAVTTASDEQLIRARYGVPDGVCLRVSADEVLAYLPNHEVAVRSVATRPDTLPRAHVGGREPLRRIDSPRGALLVRPYCKGGLLRRVRGSSFRGRMRPLDEFVLLRRLEALGLPVPRAVGCAIRRRALRWQGHLITKEVGGALDLEAWLHGLSLPGQPPRRVVLTRAGRTVRMLHEAGIEHADLHPKNLILSPSGTVYVLDLDRARQSDRPLLEEARLRNLTRLARAVEKHRLKGLATTPRDGIRFLAGYAGSHKAGRLWWVRVAHRLAPTLGLRRLWWRLRGEARPWHPGAFRAVARSSARPVA